MDGCPQSVIGFVPHIVGEGLEVPGGAGQFQCARHNEGEIGGGVGGGGKNGELLDIAKRGTELEFVIMVIAVSCVKLLSAHNSTQHTSRKHKV
jgi:hypothetical protein